MTRRDIIIIATLVNAGLLAILFMMAVTSDDDIVRESFETSKALVEVKIPETRYAYEPTKPAAPVEVAIQKPAPVPVAVATVSNAQTETKPVVITKVVDPYEDPEEELPSEPQPVVQPKPATTQASQAKMVEVTVKRGDSLDKIARAHGTTVRAIKEANQLKSDRLDLGQVLQVPVNDKGSDSNSKPATSTKPVTTKSATSSTNDSNYYVMQTGDSPWKVAKKFHMDLEDLLKLNNLDEEKARNLRVGDKIRVK